MFSIFSEKLDHTTHNGGKTMTDRYVDVNSQSNLHADKNMSTKDFDNLGIYGKERMTRPRKRNKKHKNVFAEIKTLKKED